MIRHAAQLLTTRTVFAGGALPQDITGLFAPVYIDPSGQWTGKPGTLPGLPGSPAPAGGVNDPVGYAAYKASCQANYAKCRLTIPRTPGVPDECGVIRDKCLADGVTIFEQGGKLQTQNSSIPCSACGATNVPACVTCVWEYAAHAGIEIGLVALALLGLYLWLK
jgi:hypothetical protein